MVGDTVNLASRIESFTVGGQALISAAPRDACGGLLSVRDCFDVHPKVWSEPVIVFDIDGVQGDHAVQLFGAFE